MKFVLILSLCSFVSGNCLVVSDSKTQYEDWNSCMQDAMIKSKELIKELKPEEINKLKLATKYICFELEEQGMKL